MSATGTILVTTGILVAILARLVYINATSLLQPAKLLSPETIIRPSQCSVLQGDDQRLIGPEDLQRGKHGMLFIGSGDIKNTVTNGALRASPGGIYGWNISGPLPNPAARLHLSGLTHPELPLQVHGLFVSNLNDRLYAVAHRAN